MGNEKEQLSRWLADDRVEHVEIGDGPLKGRTIQLTSTQSEHGFFILLNNDLDANWWKEGRDPDVPLVAYQDSGRTTIAGERVFVLRDPE